MTKIVLLRHGPTSWTPHHKLQGQRDVPLSDEGRAMVRGWTLPNWVSACQWYTSPLSRAQETAEILGGENIVPEDRLKEMDWAHWEGETLDELRQKYGPVMADNEARGLDFCPDGGESPRELLERLHPWFTEIGAADRSVFAVTHKGVIRAVMAKASGWDMVGKPPVKTKWGTLHMFEVDKAGHLEMLEADNSMVEQS